MTVMALVLVFSPRVKCQSTAADRPNGAGSCSGERFWQTDADRLLENQQQIFQMLQRH